MTRDPCRNRNGRPKKPFIDFKYADLVANHQGPYHRAYTCPSCGRIHVGRVKRRNR